MSVNLYANSIRPGYQLAAVEYCATTAIRRLLEEPETPSTRSYLLTALIAVADLLPSRFAYEEAGGGLMEIEAMYPEKQPEILLHCIERAMLYEDLRDLRSDLKSMDSDAGDYSDWSERMSAWLDRLAAHEQEEEQLGCLMTR